MMSVMPIALLYATALVSAQTVGDTSAGGVDLNGLVVGGSGVGIGAGLLLVIRMVLDRTLPGRSDQRANVQIMLESLNNVIKVMQEEKSADAKRLEDKQNRINALETEAEKDYDRISELRAEIIDLRQRLAVKDRHINALVSQLRRLGVLVTGIELEDTDLEITFTKQEIQDARDRSAPEPH